VNAATTHREAAVVLLRTLRRMGYVATVDEARRLRLRGSSRLPAELEHSVRIGRDELVRLVEEEIVVDEREVFDMARAFFGKGERGAA
jgi:hypothetical protein